MSTTDGLVLQNAATQKQPVRRNVVEANNRPQVYQNPFGQLNCNPMDCDLMGMPDTSFMDESIFNAMPNNYGSGNLGGFGFGGAGDLGNLGFFGGAPNYLPFGANPQELLEYQKNNLQYQQNSIQGQEQLDGFQLDRQVRQKHRNEAAQFKLNAPDMAIMMQAGTLQRVIKENDQDNFMGEFSKLQQLVKEKLEEGGSKNIPEDQLRAETVSAYREATGQNLFTDLESHGDGSFKQGFKSGATLGLGKLCGLQNGRTLAENLDDVTGKAPNRKDKAQGVVGSIAGGATTLAIGAGIIKILKSLRR
ncbi:MAG: hypothetical protein PHC64_07925 [Candidatus Gastranaerophilales bacterium]|nr:hypothetical protein [Candidatus Gastranaerophilales bacterium]